MGSWIGSIADYNKSNKDRDEKTAIKKKEIADFVKSFDGDWALYYEFISKYKGLDEYGERCLNESFCKGN